MKRQLIYLVLLIFPATVIVQGQMLPVSNKEKTIIPFRLTSYNYIVVKARINNQDTTNLMVHTAASDVTLLYDSLSKVKSIKLDGTVDNVKSWGGSTNSSDYSKNNSMQIQDLHWKNLMIWFDKNSGQETDGKIGLNLFKDRVVEMDFNKNVLTIESTLPRKIKKYAKYKLTIQNGGMYISGVCQTDKNSYEHTFLIHTGYASGLLLDDQFSNETNMDQQIKITGERTISDAFGNVLTTKKGILPIFKIGNAQLANVPVSFFKGGLGKQKISIVGCDVLKRFNWIIDAKREYIYLLPNSLFNTSYSNI